MSFITKVELKTQLEKMGIKVEGNYIRKKDIKKIKEETILAVEKMFHMRKADDSI